MGKRKKTGRPIRNFASNRPAPAKGKLRVIGGRFRGRQLDYSGDLRTRPMKDNIREALFNLVGGWIPGKYVFDLFAGTAAIGIEAMSRGAVGATFIERHVPSIKIIKSNLGLLELHDQTRVETSDTFFWVRQFFNQSDFPVEPWAVFISPPYDLFLERQEEMLELIQRFCEAAPADSLIAVEADQRFSAKLLPEPELWRTKSYSPALICIRRKTRKTA